MTLQPPDDATRLTGRPPEGGPPVGGLPVGSPSVGDRAGSTPGATGPAGGHLDDLAAMLLADGQPVASPLAHHATGCGLCSALVAAFRSDTVLLGGALTLDESELDCLAAAGLPARVAGAVPGWERQRDTPATLLAMLLTAGAAFAVWALAQPLLGTAVDVARRSGAVAVGTRIVTDWLLDLLFAFLQLFTAAETTRLLQNPALPLALLALLAWLAIWLFPLVPRPVLRAPVA